MTPALPPAGPPEPHEPIDWLALWAVGRYHLGVTDAELDTLTFTEFAALAAQHRQAMRDADRRAATVAWTVARANGADVELEAFIPKTQYELDCEREAAMLNQLAAWHTKAAGQRATN